MFNVLGLYDFFLNIPNTWILSVASIKETLVFNNIYFGGVCVNNFEGVKFTVRLSVKQLPHPSLFVAR